MKQLDEKAPATKQDLEQTKQELVNQLASKQELREAIQEAKNELIGRPVSKEELQQAVAKLATKEELEKVKTSVDILVRQMMANTQKLDKLDKLDTEVTLLRIDFNQERAENAAFRREIREKLEIIIQKLLMASFLELKDTTPKSWLQTTPSAATKDAWMIMKGAFKSSRVPS